MIRNVVSLIVLAAACSREPAPAPAPASGGGAAAALDELDGLDGRKPVPLLPMMANHQKADMRDHLAAVEEIVRGLAADDLAAVERAAGRIGFSEQMGQTCTHMGMGAAGFTDEAIAFHRTADGIGAAARAGDRTRVLAELSSTLQRCTGCHATWKQQVVDEDEWQRLTGSPSPHSGGATSR